MCRGGKFWKVFKQKNNIIYMKSYMLVCDVTKDLSVRLDKTFKWIKYQIKCIVCGKLKSHK